MNPDLTPDAIQHLIRSHYSGKPEELNQLIQWLRDRDQDMRRMELDFKTTFEIANQINSKGLDTRRIESYTMTTLRGQFGVLKVQLLRQDDMGGNWIGAFNSEAEDKWGFDLDGAFAQGLTVHPTPTLLDHLPDELRTMPEIQRWKSAGILLMAPLFRNETELKGVILMGPKFNKSDYTANDIKFLSLISSMVGVALHNAQLYMRSILDGLTKVFTRGHFDIQLEQEIDRIQRYQHKGGRAGRHVSLIMMDVDKFKSINDRYGHQVGDAVLIEMAHTVKDNIRSMDVLARYGGEEFVLICPETSKEEASILAERLRRKVEAATVATEQHGMLKMTISLGVSTFPDDAETGRELVLQADMAMYQAKEGGRNLAVAAPDGHVITTVGGA